MTLRQRLKRANSGLFGKPLTRVLDYCIGVPLVSAMALARRKRTMPDTVVRIGVFCSPTMGDTVLFSAVLLDLRVHFGPDTEIVHFCGKKNVLAAELLAGADRRVTIELTRPQIAARQMRTERLDVLFDFSSWQRVTAVLALLSGSRFTVGFRSAGQHRAAGYDLTVKHRADQHELENFRDLLRGAKVPVGSEPRIAAADVDLPEPWRGAAEVVILHLWPAGGPESRREWPQERWLALAKGVATEKTLFAITGSPADRDRSEAFAARLRTEGDVRAEAFRGGDGLRQLVTLMRRSRLVVSVNTGVMHLAAILGAPTVSLNGPTAGHRWGPRGECCAGIAPADGSGGYLHFGFEFHAGMPDVMQEITVDQVAEAADALAALGGGRQKRECGSEPIHPG